MITIHNVRTESPQDTGADIILYCGRGEREDMIPTCLGNPFVIKGAITRDNVCDDFDAWLRHGVDADKQRTVARRIGDRHAEGKHIALFCWCAPLRCHCESIRQYALESMEVIND